MPFPICDPCKVRKNCAGKGFIEGSIVQCLMASAISYTPKMPDLLCADQAFLSFAPKK